MKLGQNKLFKKSVGMPGFKPKNQDCPGKAGTDGQPDLVNSCYCVMYLVRVNTAEK